MEPADTPVAPNERETPQIDEDNRAVEDPPVSVDSLTPETPPVMVDSPVAVAPPVPLEHSQHTRIPPSYLQDFFCDLVYMHTIL